MARSTHKTTLPGTIYFVKAEGDELIGPYRIKPTLLARGRNGIIQEYYLVFKKEYKPKEKEK